MFKTQRSLKEYFRKKKDKTKSLSNFNALLLSPRRGQAGAGGTAGTAGPSRRFPGSGSGTELPAGREERRWAPPPAPDKGPGGARPGPMAIPMVPMETQLQSIFEEVVVSPSPERRRCRDSAGGRPAACPGPCGPPCSLCGGGAILEEMKAGGRGALGFHGSVGAVELRRCPRPCVALFPKVILQGCSLPPPGFIGKPGQ